MPGASIRSDAILTHLFGISKKTENVFLSLDIYFDYFFDFIQKLNGSNLIGAHCIEYAIILFGI